MRYIVLMLMIGGLLAQASADPYGTIRLTEREAAAIGRQIWLNETGGQAEHLIFWNEGETFASLGIGHFIWYPAGRDGPFEESFPALLTYLQRREIALPDWLRADSDCPWATRENFLQDRQGVQMNDLRALLTRTVPQQVGFIVQRLELALPRITAHLPTDEERRRVREQFYRVANSSQGIYALMDYVNFKGEGISAQERYHNQGWGLLQVLQQMPGTSTNPVEEFADAAEFVLTRRVRNAPPERRDREARWLPGWKARITTYRGHL